MGQWVMVITGEGIHDNNREDDADKLLGKFVDELTYSQVVTSASFTVGYSREFGSASKAVDPQVLPGTGG